MGAEAAKVVAGALADEKQLSRVVYVPTTLITAANAAE